MLKSIIPAFLTALLATLAGGLAAQQQPAVAENRQDEVINLDRGVGLDLGSR